MKMFLILLILPPTITTEQIHPLGSIVWNIHTEDYKAPSISYNVVVDYNQYDIVVYDPENQLTFTTFAAPHKKNLKDMVQQEMEDIDTEILTLLQKRQFWEDIDRNLED